MKDDGPGTILRASALVSIAGAPFATIILVVLAIIAGRALDKWLGTTPWLLLVLIVISIPLSLLIMVRSALAVGRANLARERSPTDPPTGHEEDNT